MIFDPDEVASDPWWMDVVKVALATTPLTRQKFNQLHEPAGSPAGGQFASSGGTPTASFAADETRRHAFEASMVDRLGGSSELTQKIEASRAEAKTEWGTDSELYMSYLAGSVTAPDGVNTIGNAIIDKNAADIAAASNGALTAEEAKGFIWSWRNAASEAASIAMVAAAGKKFGIEPNEVQRQREILAVDSANERPALGDYSTEITDWKTLSQKASAFIDAQYTVTQKYLSDHGVTGVDLFRGFTKDDAELTGPLAPLKGATDWTGLTVSGRAATGWAADYKTANSFSGWYEEGSTSPIHGYVLAAHIPAKDILAAGYTGLGDTNEGEYAVIGRPHAAYARYGRSGDDPYGAVIPALLSRPD